MKQIIITVQHMASSHTVSSMPLDVDAGYEQETLEKAKANLKTVVESGGMLTIQKDDNTYVIIPPELLKHCLVSARLQYCSDPYPYPYTDAGS